MLKPKFDIELLNKAVHEVARLVPGSELFAWMASSLAVPLGWAGLAFRRDQDPLLVPSGSRCEREETQEILFIRTAPVECSAQDASLQSRDGHACTGLIRVPVRILTDPSELTAFRQTLLGTGEVLAVAGLQRYLQWQMRRVLADLAGRFTAAELLGALDPAVVQQAVAERLGAACLAAGLALEGPAAVYFESAAFREHCRQRTQLEHQQHRTEVRTQIQQAMATAQRQHLTHLLGMLEQMRTCAGNRRSISDLLRTFSPDDRGQMYAALWHLCPPIQQTQAVAAVSGQELLLFRPDELPRLWRRVRLPETLGPLRSVTADAASRQAGVMLVGAASGVHVVDIERLTVRQSLPAPSRGFSGVRGGVNRAAMSDDHVYASHSEMGLLAWPWQKSRAIEARPFCAETTQGAGTVRGVQVGEGALWWATDQTLWSLQLDNPAALPICYSGGGAVITALTVADGAVYAGNADGQIITWVIGEPDRPCVVRGVTASPVESVAVVETAGVAHLVVAERARGLHASVIGDQYVRRYESGSRIIRRAAAAPDLFLAMNDNRDLLLAWNPREPLDTLATVVVPHLTGSSVQDIALIPAPAPVGADRDAAPSA